MTTTTDTITAKEAVEKLLKKAVDTERSDDAMRFSQAAVNAANARYGLAAEPGTQGT